MIPPASAGWYPMDFPGQPPGRNNRTDLWLRIKLPDEPVPTPAIFTKFVWQSYELYMDDALIHQYIDPEQTGEHRFAPFLPWHLVELPANSPEKTLYFHIHSVAPSIGILGKVMYAPLFTILRDQTLLDLFKVVPAALALFLGMLALVLYLRDRRNSLYLAFAGSSLLGAILVFRGTFAAMLLINDTTFWSHVIAASIIYWPVLVLTFLFHLADAHCQSYLKKLIGLNLVFASTGIGLFWYDPTLMKFIHLASLLVNYISYAVTLYIFRNKLRASQEAQIYFVSTTFWLATLSYDALVVMQVLPLRTPTVFLGQMAEMAALSAILLLRYHAAQYRYQQTSLELAEKNTDLLAMQASLETINQSLENTVAARTRDLTVQKSCLQQLFEKSPDAVSLLSDDYRVMNVNDAFEQLFMVSRDTVTGLLIDTLITFADNKNVYDLRAALTAGHTVQLDTYCQLADGHWRHITLTAYPFITAIDTNGIYMIFRDISARKAAEKLLADSARQFRLLAENTSDIIWLMDENMSLLYVSPSIKKLLGFTVDEIMCQPPGQRLFPLPAADLTDFTRMCSQPASASFFPVLVEKQLPHNITGTVWTESLINIARNEAGEKIGYLGITRNISERKQTQELLSHSYERKKTNDFFLSLLHSPASQESQMYFQALCNNIPLPREFSLYVLTIGDTLTTGQPFEKTISTRILVDTIIDQLNMQENTIAWEFSTKIGIVHSFAAVTDRVAEECRQAETYLQWLHSLAPGTAFKIGIAEYADGLTNFSLRFKHAMTAIITGTIVWPALSVYHYKNCGVYQILAQYADSADAAAYVEGTLGPLLEYDRINTTDLMLTLEKILASTSLREVANQLFCHHKTILARKQRIEAILQASLDSFETRMTLGAAIHISKLLPKRIQDTE